MFIDGWIECEVQDRHSSSFTLFGKLKNRLFVYETQNKPLPSMVEEKMCVFVLFLLFLVSGWWWCKDFIRQLLCRVCRCGELASKCVMNCSFSFFSRAIHNPQL